MSLKSTQKIENGRVVLEITADKDTFEAALERAFKKEGAKITVPGFRKGKAPRRIIERYYGSEVFCNDAVDIMFPELYESAIAESGFEPVARPEAEVTSISADGVEFKVTIVIKPDIEIGEYKGLAAEKKVYTITDDEIDAEIERARRRLVRNVEVTDRPVKAGDTVTIDFDGSIDGVKFEGGHGENYKLTIGSGSFIPGFEDQLIGKSAGDEFDINVTFPEDYHAEEFKGKPAVFHVVIHSITESILPEIDDQFVSEVSETSNTVTEYREEIKNNLLNQRTRDAEAQLESKLIEQVANTIKGDIPNELYENAIDSLVQELGYRLSMQGMNLDMYMSYLGTDEDGLRASYRERAMARVKSQLVLEKIAELENIVITDEDIEAEYTRMADQYHEELDKVKQYISAKDLTADLKLKKAAEILVANAVITEIDGKAADEQERLAQQAAFEASMKEKEQSEKADDTGSEANKEEE